MVAVQHCVGDQREARRAAEEIVVKYLGDSENGPASYGEVNLDESMKTQIIDAVCSSSTLHILCVSELTTPGEPLSQDLFVESQGWIFSLMADDCYRKFLQCPKFKQYKGIQTIVGELCLNAPSKWRALRPKRRRKEGKP